MSELEKKAMGPKAKMALKILAGVGGVGAVGGAGVGGYRFGANRMGNAMAEEFTEQNALKNEGIINRFNSMNALENKQITSQAYRQGAIDLLNKLKYASRPAVGDGTGPYGRGMGPGMGRADGTGLMKQSSDETMEKIATAAMIDELEKIALDIPGLATKFKGGAGRAKEFVMKKLQPYIERLKTSFTGKVKGTGDSGFASNIHSAKADNSYVNTVREAIKKRKNSNKGGMPLASIFA